MLYQLFKFEEKIYMYSSALKQCKSIEIICLLKNSKKLSVKQLGSGAFIEVGFFLAFTVGKKF